MRLKADDTMKLLLEENLIDDSEKELINYGIKRAKSIGISIVVSLLLGCCMGILPESSLFLISIILLRSYAGGFHAKNSKSCGVISFLILIFAYLVIKYLVIDTGVIVAILTICLYVIYFFAPMESANRELDSIEKKVFKKIARIISAILYIGVICCIYLQQKSYANALFSSIVVAAGLIIVEVVMVKIRNKRGKSENAKEEKN
ncbi:MAG: accessory gene regulator B family protein [Bacillota bacterium]|nr:accessory gene regulator B family protein [Bacillota bacterium]